MFRLRRAPISGEGHPGPWPLRPIGSEKAGSGQEISSTARLICAIASLVVLAPGLSVAKGPTGAYIPDEARPVHERIAGIRAVSKGRFGLAFPPRLGQVSTNPAPNARGLGESYELRHGFNDGSTLSYFGSWGETSSSIYLQHGRSDDHDEYAAEIMSFEDQGEGYASHSLSFYEGLTEGEVWLSRGRSLWGSSVEGGVASEGFSEAMVSTFRTFYDVDSWGYASQDFTYQVGDAFRYEGGGEYGEGGLDQRYFGSVELALGGFPYATCESEGEVLSEPEGAQGFATEAWDRCRQLEEGGAYWESWTFTSNLNVAGEGWKTVFTQEVICSDEEGAERRYTWQDGEDGNPGYVDVESGELYEEPACAWDPALEMSTY